MGSEDANVEARLVAAVQARRIDVPRDLDAMEDLLARHPGSANLERLAEALFVRAAELHKQPPPATAAMEILERATLALSSSFVVRFSLAQLETEASLWPKAERSASIAVSLNPSAPEPLALLGYLLMRQDRDREALEALQASLELREDARTRALLEQVTRSLAAQKGMTEQRLSHFHVRYDGDTLEAVGREVLRALERHYVTLVLTFSHELETTVPVILYTNRSYYDATGAPAWSGGAYSHLDGRISLPIGGVTGGLPVDADRALIHELAHAFVHDMGGPAVPREIHEGIAQLLEGEKCEGARPSQDLQIVAAGGRNDVGGFYLAALCFAEDLHRQRGQAGLNDLLHEIRSTRNIDQAFDRVYGRTYSASVAAWRADMRRRHSS